MAFVCWLPRVSLSFCIQGGVEFLKRERERESWLSSIFGPYPEFGASEAPNLRVCDDVLTYGRLFCCKEEGEVCALKFLRSIEEF